MIIENVSQYDVEKLEGSRLSFFNIVSRLFDSKDLSFRLSISEGLFALYSAYSLCLKVCLPLSNATKIPSSFFNEVAKKITVPNRKGEITAILKNTIKKC